MKGRSVRGDGPAANTAGPFRLRYAGNALR